MCKPSFLKALRPCCSIQGNKKKQQEDADWAPPIHTGTCKIWKTHIQKSCKSTRRATGVPPIKKQNERKTSHQTHEIHILLKQFKINFWRFDRFQILLPQRGIRMKSPWNIPEAATNMSILPAVDCSIDPTVAVDCQVGNVAKPQGRMKSHV